MTTDGSPDRDSAVASLHADGTVGSASGEEADVPADLKRDFWGLVGLFNVALLGISIGLMLIAFEEQVGIGAAVVALGAVALVAGVRRYRRRNA